MRVNGEHAFTAFLDVDECSLLQWQSRARRSGKLENSLG